MALTDISAQFLFRQWTQGNFSYKEASGELGVPGTVAKHRIEAEQTAMSSGTGDHAGHLIGIQFGAPGDVRNLGLQNANMNTFALKALQPAFQGHGGSYHDLESRWTEQLKLRFQNQGDGERQISQGRESAVLSMGAMDRNQTWRSSGAGAGAGVRKFQLPSAAGGESIKPCARPKAPECLSLRLEPGNPARDRSAILFVRIAELAEQSRFLVEDDKQLHRHTEECGVSQEQRGVEGCCLAQKHSEYADIHGVANVAVQGGGDEKFRRSDGSGSAQSANRELPGATEVDRRAEQDDKHAEPRQRAGCWPRKAAQYPGRDENQHRSGHEDREEQRLQDGAEGARHTGVKKIGRKTGGITLL